MAVLTGMGHKKAQEAQRIISILGISIVLSVPFCGYVESFAGCAQKLADQLSYE
jgi:hypothetical protein